ncbi:hypothetical protein AAFP35_09055 [Gordonia sp. CPCC 206044]|uniref:hypothetical protein n=1 Tax=Gordonia sp. CPCC 206044 TaxID=3140793 RepID=UPI003AF35EF5
MSDDEVAVPVGGWTDWMIAISQMMARVASMDAEAATTDAQTLRAAVDAANDAARELLVFADDDLTGAAADASRARAHALFGHIVTGAESVSGGIEALAGAQGVLAEATRHQTALRSYRDAIAERPEDAAEMVSRAAALMESIYNGPMSAALARVPNPQVAEQLATTTAAVGIGVRDDIGTHGESHGGELVAAPTPDSAPTPYSASSAASHSPAGPVGGESAPLVTGSVPAARATADRQAADRSSASASHADTSTTSTTGPRSATSDGTAMTSGARPADPDGTDARGLRARSGASDEADRTTPTSAVASENRAEAVAGQRDPLGRGIASPTLGGAGAPDEPLSARRPGGLSATSVPPPTTPIPPGTRSSPFGTMGATPAAARGRGSDDVHTAAHHLRGRGNGKRIVGTLPLVGPAVIGERPQRRESTATAESERAVVPEASTAEPDRPS